MQSYQGTVGVVQAQTVYILEVATNGRNDVASKEYMDFKHARQAFDDAVLTCEQAGKWSHVTRIELFNDVSGSLMRWVLKEPALASANVVHTMEQLKDEACKQYALRVAAVERCDELQSELSKALELLEHAEGAIPGGGEWQWLLDHIAEFHCNQSAPADKDVQP